MITEGLATPSFPPSLVFLDVDEAVLEAEDRRERSTDYGAWAMFMTRTLTSPVARRDQSPDYATAD